MKTKGFVGMAVLVAAVLISSGCGKSELVTEMEGLADRMCACEDTKCTDGVVADLEKFDKENNGKKVTKGDNEKIKAALSRATKCLTEVRAKSLPTAEDPASDIEKAADEVENEVEAAGEKAAEELKEAGQATEKAAEEAGQEVEGAAEKTGEAVEDAAKEVEGAAEKAADEVEEAVDDDEE